MGLLDVVPNQFRSSGEVLADFLPYQAADGKAVTEPSEEARKKKFEQLGLREAQAAARPINGIQIKPNTHAVVQVIDRNGMPVAVFNKLGSPKHPLYGGSYTGRTMKASKLHNDEPESNWPLFGSISSNAGSGSDFGFSAGVDSDGNPASKSWTDWILQTVREERTEKTQLVETFGDNYLYSYGQKPRVLSFSGMLMNTADMQWKAIFWENWDKYFRASKLQEKHARMYISFDDTIVEGYPITAVAQQSAESPYAILFQFNFFVTNYISSAINKARLTNTVGNRPLWQVRAGYDFQNMKWAKHSFFGVDSITDLLTTGAMGRYVGQSMYDTLVKLPGMDNWAGKLTSNFVSKLLRRTVNAGISTVNALTYNANRRPDIGSIWENWGIKALGDTFVFAGDLAQGAIDNEGSPGVQWSLNINELLGYAGKLIGRQYDRSNTTDTGLGGMPWGSTLPLSLANGRDTAAVFNMGYEALARVAAVSLIVPSRRKKGNDVHKEYKESVAAITKQLASIGPVAFVPPDEEEADG